MQSTYKTETYLESGYALRKGSAGHPTRNHKILRQCPGLYHKMPGSAEFSRPQDKQSA
jgi:hypothetical protein